jgi:two-component system sensor histidine kinase/response regulator
MNKKMNTTFNPQDYIILMVDDLPKNIQVLGSTLRSNNYEVEYATSGEKALDWIEKIDFDLILLDIMMPGMDGFEVCKTIRSNPVYNDIPIIFLTAKVDRESILKGFQLGGQDYITKPFDASELLARVKTHLELKASKQQLNETNIRLEQMVAERTKELQKANEKLLELDTAKSQFLKIISHEIRTPLNGIVNGIELMNEIKVTDEMQLFLDILTESSARLEKFAYKALDISNLNINGIAAMDILPLDIDALMETMITRNQNKANAKGLKFGFTAGENIVYADTEYLAKCVEHIIDNAIKYAFPNSTIKIDITDEGKLIKISVEDEGEKFPDGYDINDAEAFASVKHIDQNPGLSLYLCKLIVEAHNGKVRTANTENGARITVELPVPE